MPVINQGILNIDDVYLREVGNDWPTAQVISTSDVIENESNLYFTNTRVVSALIAGDNITIESNGRISAVISDASNAETSNVANTVLTISNFTTNDLAEGSNLYYTNSRTRSAFTAGKNVTITPDGVISSRDDTGIFNIDIDGSTPYRLTENMEEAKSFGSITANSKAILKSLHFTNITDTIAYFSGNIVFSDGNTAILANKIPVPEGTSLEFLDRPFIFSRNDVINLQGFDSSETPAANLIDCIFTYETVFGDISYKSIGYDILDNNPRLILDSADAHHIVESIRLVNIDNSTSKANVYITDANDNIKAFIVHGMSIPTNTSVEVLNSSKRINLGDKLYVSKNSPNISALCAYRLGEISYVVGQTTEVVGGGNLVITVATSIPEGTTIYYSIQ